MAVYFVRTNGNTAHNEPETPGFVAGEPPVFETDGNHFNYRTKCLREGFVRIGWPNTGDLRNPGTGALAREEFSYESGFENYHRDFLGIRTGDHILIPAGEEKGWVHLGSVVLRDPQDRRRILTTQPCLFAYYYFHDIPRGEWYECAHRIDVLWARETDGSPLAREIEGVIGRWRYPISRIDQAQNSVLEIARSVGLPATCHDCSQ